jgi:hypothetical protein
MQVVGEHMVKVFLTDQEMLDQILAAVGVENLLLQNLPQALPEREEIQVL